MLGRGPLKTVYKLSGSRVELCLLWDNSCFTVKVANYIWVERFLHQYCQSLFELIQFHSLGAIS